jgi:hypothetical protein
MLTIESKQRICHMILLKDIKKWYKDLESNNTKMTTEYNKYHNSRLYKITTRKYPQLVYIGSTFFTVENRLYQHEADYKSYLKGFHNYVASFDIIKHGDYEITELCELFCNNNEELRQHEQDIINCFGHNKIIVNKHRAYRSPEQRQEYIKQYRQDNAEKIKEMDKRYRLKNAEKLKEKYNCECGGKYTSKHRARHFKSPKHQKYINNQ